MAWFYVDDGFSDSKPVLNMPDRYRLAACGLWVLAGSWSAKEELDGFVPDSKLRQLGARPQIVDVLTDPGPMSAPLCTRVSTGIQFNSWSKWQPTREELIAEREENERKREAEAERKRRQRAEKNEENPPRRRRKRKGRNAVTSTNAEIVPVVSEICPAGQTTDVQRDSRARAGARLDPTRPDPTRPSLTTNGHLGREGHLGNRASLTPPPEFCPSHPGGTDKPCQPCGDHRKAHQAWERERETDAADRRRAFVQEIRDCPACDDKGWLPDGNSSLTRCPNHNWQEFAHA